MANKAIAQASSATSPTTNKSGTYVEVPLSDTIPIIFVPGIMGSNIFNTSLKKPVWMIGNGISGQVSTLTKQMGKSPATLQTELDYLHTRVDESGEIQVDNRLKLSKKILRERYWGTVHWDSYGGILTYLQLVLNNVDVNEKPIVGGWIGSSAAVTYQLKQQEAIYEWKSLLDKNETKQWFPQPSQAFVATNQQEIEHLKKFHFPVYAMGYNWLQSSENGAAIVAGKLDKIKQEYGARFRKFIIITHSMGGLLTRRLVQLRGADIAGVVHGVMPAEGAAAAYRRIVTGSADVGALPAYVLGKNTEHVTAVLANAPGGLELLPSKAYNGGKPWLFLNGSGLMNGKDLQTNVVSLPRSDPYEEIYKADGVWWEMVKEELIDPANMVKRDNPDKNVKDIYKKKINSVNDFHSKITNKYHPCTYANYGHDPKHSSFGTLTWTLDQALRGLTAEQMQRLPRVSAQEVEAYNQGVAKDAISMGQGAMYYMKANIKDNNGLRYIRLTSGKFGTFKISDKDSDGDGTVPYQSGCAPLGQSGVKQVFKMTGFDHQGSYNNIHVKRSVLYSIVKIIKENNIQPKFR
ncbi:alpha/beta hydrolase [Acinetobacter colistiniresistens]|uniref:esterase/lipase family protein n=1 Tax=Acinetobacter colistiniresistens TaxID=280145 RepID=UPI00211B7597|nr:alpha/beta hydrolase [Acinetobacter colistiniresistens]UUM26619.1 alpha/beta hydrolase [Acinetobacter colistiniresistens]